MNPIPYTVIVLTESYLFCYIGTYLRITAVLVLYVSNVLQRFLFCRLTNTIHTHMKISAKPGRYRCLLDCLSHYGLTEVKVNVDMYSASS